MSYHLVDGIGNRRIGLDPPGIDAGRRPTSLLHCTYTHLSRDVFLWSDYSSPLITNDFAIDEINNLRRNAI
jgi:hypothetical protein